MSNMCYIKNTKKMTPDQVIDLVNQEFMKKFNLSCTGTFDPDHDYLSIEIKGLFFSSIMTPERLEFFDSSSTSFIKLHERDCPYFNQFIFANQRFPLLSICAYSYLLSYLKNFLAKSLNTTLDTDSQGPIEPFDPAFALESYTAWISKIKSHSRKWTSQDEQDLILILKKEESFFPEVK